MSEDRIYSMPLERVGDFQFDERVVEVFPDMIARSVPGYGSILAMTGELAEEYAQPGSNIYDLGCSLGAATLLVRPRVPADCRIEAIDSSSAMVSRLRKILDDHDNANPSALGCEVRVNEADVREVAIERASFAILNFTLQFIDLKERSDLLQRIADGLLPGGALVLSEKVHFEGEAQQALMTDLHHAFKRANGYSNLEIAQKRSALENTLVTETIETHTRRLQDVGFSSVSMWFQCFNFVSILAIR